jgi:GNAT superfamily N-acetyltransferase
MQLEGGSLVPTIEVRPFQRSDRDQLTGLVNAHVAPVIPGVTLSVNTVMSQLEREPAEAIVDPWVVERRTLVAVSRDAIVAGALLHRFGTDERVGPDYRNAGEIRWLVCGFDDDAAGDALMEACIATMDEWRVDRQYAAGELPAPAVYGVPACWPHIRRLYLRHGFEWNGRVEIILVAPVAALPATQEPPLSDLGLRRTVGACGVRFAADRAGETVGYIEVEIRSDADPRARQFGWSDIGNLWIRDDLCRQGIGTWLLAGAADWLRLGGIERLLAYAWPEEEAELAFLSRHGFEELVRSERGWERTGVRTSH